MDEDGTQKHPYILHCSPSGAIERDIYGILEREAMRLQADESYKPRLPLWLAPTQVRIIPVSQDHVGFADEVRGMFEKVRVDIDDRDETVGKKIRDAEKEWVPYIIVVGEREQGKERLPVRVRGEKDTQSMAVSELQDMIHAETRGKPYRPVPEPVYLQDRPKFVG